MKCFEVTLPVKKKDEYVNIAVICCLHIGSKFCHIPKALEWRAWIMGDPRHFVFNLGDDTESALPGDEKHNSMMWDQNLSPEQQFLDAADYWSPVAKKEKLVLTHDSNHWWRHEAKTGRSAAKELNVFLQGVNPKQRMLTPEPQPDYLPRWARWQALTKLHVGDQTYNFHSWHGVGNGCTPEAALRKCRSMASQHPWPEIYLMGHVHNPIYWSDERTEFTSNGEDAAFQERHFACTGGFLKWNSSYAERQGLPPNRLGAIVVKLATKRWDVKVSR